MHLLDKFYIDGKWTAPKGSDVADIINPSTGKVSGKLSLGTAADVDAAVEAARLAFETFGFTSRQERLEILDALIGEYKKYMADMAELVRLEMGAPKSFAEQAQAPSGLVHLLTAREALKSYPFEEVMGTTRVLKEPIGVVGMITPWNWPINQITCKVGPALATGCTIVLKPSEIAPYSAQLFAEIVDAAGVPAGVFNMVPGTGAVVGEAISGHPGIDMVSFTGSTKAGSRVQENAAKTIKRVTQELGGKSANIILDDADFEKTVWQDTVKTMRNTGQTCTLLSRMLVPHERLAEAMEIARKAADSVKTGDPADAETDMGPIAHRAQYEKVQSLIQVGLDEGAELVAGGLGQPDGLSADLQGGFFVKPTVFGAVTPDMTLAREEVFGPVLAIMGYKDEDEAVKIANDSPYGLSGAVSSGDLERARRVARKLRTGMVHINGAPTDDKAPFGGYKQSGNGREWGAHAFADFLELKSVMGFGDG